MDEINDWQEQPIQAGQVPVATGQPGQPNDWQEVSLQKQDKNTGEDIPLAFSGNSPASAMNKSPLSVWDRFKLSMGNQQGNIEYLKKQFDDVQPISKDSSELAVKKQGTWYRVDPDNGDIRDPWALTKSYMNDPSEFVKDMADMGPMGIAVGAGALAAAAYAGPEVTSAGLAEAGTGLAAGVALDAAVASGVISGATRTSLGRYMGTYDATPLEQLADVGMEAVLNAVGYKVQAGVKPYAGWMADKLKPIADTFKDTLEENTPDMVKNAASAIANSPKSMFKKLFAGMSVGVDNFDKTVEYPDEVKSWMKIASMGKGGTDQSAFHDNVVGRQVQQVKGVVENVPSMLNQIYGSLRNQIVSEVPENFSTNFDEALHSTYSDALQGGWGKLVTNEGKDLAGADAVEYMAKNGMKGARFQMLDQRALAGLIKSGNKELDEQIGALATSKNAYGLLKEYYEGIGELAGGVDRIGQSGAKEILNFKKVTTNLAYELADSDKAQALKGIRDTLNSSRAGIDQAVRDSLESAKTGLGAQFDNLNATYSNLKQQAQPLLNVMKQAQTSNTDKPYELLLNKFLSRGGKSITEKEGIGAVQAAADKYGLKAISNDISDAVHQVELGEAAKAWNPLKPAGQKEAFARMSMWLYAAQLAYNGHPALAIALSAPAAAGSRGFAALGVSAFRAQQMLSQMPKDQITQLLNSPQAMQMFTSGITNAAMTRIKADQGLQQQIQGATGQGGGQ